MSAIVQNVSNDPGPFGAANILVVDDVAENVDILRRRLTRANFDVSAVENGRDALERIQTHRPDLVLLDWMMPELSGIEVLKTLRENYSTSQLPVIMVTAREDASSIVEAFKLGANDYIAKPFEFEIVLARVNAQIERLQAFRALEGLMRNARGGCQQPNEEEIFDRADLVRDAIDARRAAERKLRDALLAAESANHSKSAFLANVSHELRTPLNSIIGFADLIYRQDLGPVGNEQYIDYADHIRTGGDRLLRIVSTVLQIASLDRHNVNSDFDVWPLNQLVEKSIGQQSVNAGEKGITISFAPLNDVHCLIADPRSVIQAVSAILNNAICFSREGGVVNIVLRSNDAAATLSVCDSGRGMDERTLSRVLDPFEKGCPHLSNEHDGIGLGLTLAKAVVEANRGELMLSSTPDVGTTVTMRFPRSPTAHESPDAGVEGGIGLSKGPDQSEGNEHRL